MFAVVTLSIDATTRPILFPSLKTEVVLAPGRLEAGARETEEEDTGAGGRCAGSPLLVLSN